MRSRSKTLGILARLLIVILAVPAAIIEVPWCIALVCIMPLYVLFWLVQYIIFGKVKYDATDDTLVGIVIAPFLLLRWLHRFSKRLPIAEDNYTDGYFYEKAQQEFSKINSKTDAENIRSDWDKVIGTWWHNKNKK